MEWLIVLDPIEGLVSQTDTSIALIVQARQKGIRVDTATIDSLFFAGGAGVIATEEGGGEKRKRLQDYSLILMRKEPPYDMAFHYSTQLLSLSGTLVVNRPSSLRNFNEKLIALKFAQYMPSTLVSSDERLIIEFLEQHGGGVIKALDSFQGKAVQKIGAKDTAVIASMTEQGKFPVMVQEFLDSVYAGDKRVIMLGDQFLGCTLRRPKQGFHANFGNSDALQSELTKKEKEVLAEVGPWLVDHGIYFSGLDFIDDHLTEINITCPTGIVQISQLNGRDLAEEIVEYFIDLIAKFS
jgi:glutathione synthase